MNGIITSLTHQLFAVPGWVVLLVVSAVVFAEDALFVGFVLPGETAALIGGVTAKLGHVPLWAMLLVVVVSAVIGDTVGYEVGRHLGTRLLSHRLLDGHRDRLTRAQELLSRRGGMAVFLGRFVALFRALMPALAGASRMPYRRFAAYNMLGGAAWGIAVVLIGYLAGASYAQVGQVFGRSAAIVVVALVVIGAVAWHLTRHRRRET